MKAETEATWSERIEEWRRSGKTAPEFAAGKPYTSSTLIWAASQLRRRSNGEAKRRAARGVSDRVVSASDKVSMVRVVRRSLRADVVPEVVVDVAGARILVRRGFDSALLRDVVQALREGR